MPNEDTSLTASYSLGLLARSAAASVAAGGVGSLPFWWVFSEELGAGAAHAVQTLESLLSSLAPALALCLLAVFAAVSAALLAVTVVSSHGVAGVLFRLERLAARLGRQTLVGRVHLRAGDQAKPVAAALNAWMVRHNGRLTELRARGEAFEAALQRCEALEVGGAGVELDRALTELGCLGHGFCGERHKYP